MKTRSFASAAVASCMSFSTFAPAIADTATPVAPPAPVVATLVSPGLPANVNAVRFDYFNGTQIMCWVHKDMGDEADEKGNRSAYTAYEDGRVMIKNGKGNSLSQVLVIAAPEPGATVAPAVGVVNANGTVNPVKNANDVIEAYRAQRKTCTDNLAALAGQLQSYPDHTLPIGFDLTPRSKGGAIVRIHAYGFAR